jgi:hypothetical protein
MTSDKSGYLYLTPTMEATGGSLGQFQQSDGGLTSGTCKTQTPFQVSRHPLSGDSSPVCPKVSWTSGSVGSLSGNPCDEVHELAWFSTPVTGGGFADLMFVWPSNEAVENFKGTLPNSNKTYSFGTSPQFDPCLTTGNCTGTLPPFPAADQNSAGAPMAVAANTSPTPAVATLWAVVPRQANLLGALYGYTVNADNTSSSFGNLTRVWSWDNGTTTHACSSNPAGITGWWGPTFTEPTLADNQQNQGTGSTGAVYVPTICAETDNHQTSHTGCHNAAQNGATLVSGVLVFTTFP